MVYIHITYITYIGTKFIYIEPWSMNLINPQVHRWWACCVSPVASEGLRDGKGRMAQLQLQIFIMKFTVGAG